MKGDKIVDSKFLKSLPSWKNHGLDPLPQLCAAGRSNVGKSSLLNALAQRQGLAKTSSTPGRTQSLVIFEASFHGPEGRQPFHLIDLPGYGYAKVSKELRSQWRPMIDGYLAGNQRLAACLMLLDVRREPNDQDLELLEAMAEHNLPVLPIITKVDKVPKTQRARALKPIVAALGLESAADLWVVSAVDRTGLDELTAELGDLVRAKAASGIT
jgi:GTP-binding protein